MAAALSRRALRLAVARYRRWLVAGCVAAAVAAAVQAVAPPAPATATVPVAVRDLPAGRVLGPGDLGIGRWPAGAVPAGVLAAPAGRVLAGAVRRGEPITDARVLGPGLLAGLGPDRVAVTVRPAEPAAVAALRAGVKVDLLAGPVTGDPAGAGAGETLAADALVLAASCCAESVGGGPVGGGPAGIGGGAGSGGVLVVAVDRLAAARLAAASERPIGVAVRPPAESSG